MRETRMNIGSQACTGMLESSGIVIKQVGLKNKVMCLQLNADNSPQHLLYIGYAKQPVPYLIT